MSSKDFVIGGAVKAAVAEMEAVVAKAAKEAGSGLRISDIRGETGWYEINYAKQDWDRNVREEVRKYKDRFREAICNTVKEKNPIIEKEIIESVLDTFGTIDQYNKHMFVDDRNAYVETWVETYNQSIISTIMGVLDELLLSSYILFEDGSKGTGRWCAKTRERLIEDMVKNAICADRCLVIKAREPMKEIVLRVVVEKNGVDESAVRSILNRIDEKDENNLYENIFLTYAYLAKGDEGLMQKLRAGYGASVLDAVFSVLEEYASKLKDKTEEKEAASEGSAPAAADESAASGSLSRLEEELQWLSDSFIRVGKEAGTEVVLCNPDFVAKKLPYDGIIIGTQGIFVVKMCDYTGQLIIDTQGSWVCRKADGTEEAQKSPVSGLMKNEKLLRSIVGEDVPIISVICMTDEKTVVKNQENSKAPIQRMESLVEFMETFSNGWQLSKESRKEYQDKIEAYIV